MRVLKKIYTMHIYFHIFLYLSNKCSLMLSTFASHLLFFLKLLYFIKFGKNKTKTMQYWHYISAVLLSKYQQKMKPLLVPLGILSELS